MKTKQFLSKRAVFSGALILAGVCVTSTAFAFGPFNVENMTPEQQGVLEQVNTLREEGNCDEAQKLIQEADLRGLMGKRVGHQSEKGGMLREAIENNDFEALQELAEGTRLANMIDEETFNKRVEAYQLREAGDYQGAREIMQEIGAGKGFRDGTENGRGMGMRGMK